MRTGGLLTLYSAYTSFYEEKLYQILLKGKRDDT